MPTFTSVIALNQQTGQLIKNAAGSVYDPADTSFASPLSVTTPDGVNTTDIRVLPQGITEQFTTATLEVVVWKSGGLPAVTLTSYETFLDAVQAGRDAALAAQAAAEQAQAAAEDAAGAAQAPTADVVRDVVTDDLTAGTGVAVSLDANYFRRSEVGDRLARFFPQDFGAVGDGITDDRPAFVNAMAAAELVGGVVQLPYTAAGYGVLDQITIPSNVTLRGERGVTIKPLAAMTQLISTGTAAESPTLEGVTLTGNGFAVSYLIRAENVTGLTVRDCTIVGDAAAGQGVEVRDDAIGTTIEGCRFQDLKTCVRLNRSPIDSTVHNCEFTDWEDRAVWVLTSTAGLAADGIWITDNLIHPHKNVGDVAVRQPIQFSGLDDTPFTNVHVTGNTVEGSGTSHADPVNPGSADLISLHRCDGFTVADNIVINGGDVGITVAQQCRNGTVANNTAQRNDSVGICIGSATSTYASHITVVGNSVANNSQDRMGDGVNRARSGILLNQAVGCSLTGNSSGDNQTVPTQVFGYSIVDSTDVTASGNASSGQTDAEYYTEGTNVGLSIKQTKFASKPVDTVMNNTAVLADDPHLTVPVDRDGIYRVKAHIRYNSSDAADLALKWAHPGSDTLDWTADGPQQNTASPNTTIQRTGWTIGSTATVGGTGGNVDALPAGLLVVGSASGFLTLQWAQGAAEISDTIVRAGSWIEVERIA